MFCKVNISLFSILLNMITASMGRWVGGSVGWWVGGSVGKWSLVGWSVIGGPWVGGRWSVVGGFNKP